MASGPAWLPGRGERLAPALSGLLLALSYPPLHPLVLPFVGLIPLAVWIARLPSGREGAAAARRGAALFGAVYFGITCYWVLVALIWLTRLAVPAFLAALGLIVALTVLFGWLLHYAVVELRAPIWLSLPVTWTGLEWGRAHLPDALAFPWLGLGTSLTGFPELVGMAELVGARGVTFWIATINGLLATAVLASGTARRRCVVAAALVAIVPMSWGIHRARVLPLRAVGRVAVLQPDIPAEVKLDAQRGPDSTWAALDRLFPRVEPGAVGLAVLPEMVLPVAPESREGATDVRRLQAWAREMGAPILFGAYGRGARVGSPGDSIPYNSAFLVEPGGLQDFRYDKRRLVPLVERVPLLTRSVFPSHRDFGSYGQGTEAPLVQVDETLYGVLICFESSFADDARRYRADGVDVLVNLTNDGWYGRKPPHARTTALWQHPAHMVMRAIENRVGVVRAANTGISFVVDPVGRVRERTALFREEVLASEVYTSDVITVYTRTGDVAGRASAAGSALLLLSALLAGRRRRRDLTGGPGPVK